MGRLSDPLQDGEEELRRAPDRWAAEAVAAPPDAPPDLNVYELGTFTPRHVDWSARIVGRRSHHTRCGVGRVFVVIRSCVLGSATELAGGIASRCGGEFNFEHVVTGFLRHSRWEWEAHITPRPSISPPAHPKLAHSGVTFSIVARPSAAARWRKRYGSTEAEARAQCFKLKEINRRHAIIQEADAEGQEIRGVGSFWGEEEEEMLHAEGEKQEEDGEKVEELEQKNVDEEKDDDEVDKRQRNSGNEREKGLMGIIAAFPRTEPICADLARCIAEVAEYPPLRSHLAPSTLVTAPFIASLPSWALSAKKVVLQREDSRSAALVSAFKAAVKKYGDHRIVIAGYPGAGRPVPMGLPRILVITSSEPLARANAHRVVRQRKRKFGTIVGFIGAFDALEPTAASCIVYCTVEAGPRRMAGGAEAYLSRWSHVIVDEVGMRERGEEG
ncbi:hypothetical protein BDK51DRAFT_42285 [Blyttiomyces helicus]|uniref:Uncharacterized protein n=1 Tax=Blyttiomyces helicus TaxID=388810 RepID=A0A4P9W4I2_9FUNG|nr:hypothetical protein BDK51DRAFT_42285 [Blyttiomyces helicus]|eukprot:RKO85768.1 hypothetical protein BDK51DRAFT_42285 [Blyttiomyces helicus]